ncbi:MAG: hypothetical protein L0209_00500 [candidate division Zixibacteria bacterium]|nr:hypothetical protein [candidate division Zixibacteria bacterium]
MKLKKYFSFPIGVREQRKDRKFDLGCESPGVLVECKNHTWTEGDNAPSAKFSVWNEAMFYFMLSPKDYRKILAVRSSSSRKGKSLAKYYLGRFEHLIPYGVEIWEISEDGSSGKPVFVAPPHNKTL